MFTRLGCSFVGSHYKCFFLMYMILIYSSGESISEGDVFVPSGQRCPSDSDVKVEYLRGTGEHVLQLL